MPPPPQNENFLETLALGDLHVLRDAEFPRLERSTAPGQRFSWSPGMRFVGVSKDGMPLSNGDRFPVTELWVASPPPGWTEVPSPSDFLVVFNTPSPSFVVSGPLSVAGRFLSPSSFFFDPSCVLFCERLDKATPAPSHVSHNLSAALRLTMDGVIRLRWLGVSQVSFIPTEKTVGEHWEILGYKVFPDKKTTPVLTTGAPESLPGVLIPSHDVPKIREIFDSAKLEGGCSAGTKWSNLRLKNPRAASEFLPWASKLPPSTVIKQSHYAPNMAWFLTDELPKLSKCDSVQVREPFPQNSAPVQIGLELSSSRLELPLKEGARTASGDLLCTKRTGLTSRKDALKLHKSYDLEGVESFRLVEVSPGGSMKQGWEAFYRTADLEALPPRKSSSRGNRKALVEKYGHDAVPQCFWKYSEATIALRARLVAEMRSGKFFARSEEGCAPVPEEGFVPPHSVQTLTGLRPVPDPCDPSSFFYQKIPVDAFFSNEEWVSRLVGRMSLDYGWAMNAIVAGQFDVKRALFQSAFSQA